MVRNNLPVDVVFRFPAFEETQRFGEMVIQNDGFVPQFANQKILFLDLLLKRQGSFELLAHSLELGGTCRCSGFGALCFGT